MYYFLLVSHSYVRWVVVILALVVLFSFWKSFFGENKFGTLEEKSSMIFTISMDVQFLIGILLYLFFSPLTSSAFNNLGDAMKTPSVRFFVAEHFLLMISSLALVHVGRIKIKKAADDSTKIKSGVIYFTIAIILMLAAIPWPFYSFGRNLF